MTRLCVIAALLAGLSPSAFARSHAMSGTYAGKHGDTGTWSRTVTSSHGAYERQGSWSGTNGSGSYGGVGTRGGGTGTFNGTFTRSDGGVGTIQSTTQSTGDGHLTTGVRTKPNGDTHDFDRNRTVTANGYTITGTTTSPNGGQRQRQTVDTNGVAVTTITRPNGSVVESTRTERTGGN